MLSIFKFAIYKRPQCSMAVLYHLAVVHSRYTVMLAARADGTKIKPYIIFKGKPPKQKLNVQGATIWYSEKGWMNEELSGNNVKDSKTT